MNDPLIRRNTIQSGPMFIAALLLATSLLAPGCGGDTDSETGASCICEAATCGLNVCGEPCGTCASDSVCVSGTCTEAEACGTTGFAPTNIEATSQESEVSVRIRYRGTTKQEVAPFERMTLEIVRDDSVQGPTAAGLYDLKEASGPNCGLCISMEQDCEGSSCTRLFHPIAGQVYLSSVGEDGRISGTLTGAQFREAYVDPQTGEAYDLPHGETWCMPEFSFDQALNKNVIKGTCVAEGTGKALGEKIANYTLTNCLGEEVTLHDQCGITQAIWMIATAAWCGSCESYVKSVMDYWNQHKNRGLQVRFLFGEDNNGSQPTTQQCVAWAEGHGVDPSMVYIDHDGSGPWRTTWSHIENYAQGSIALPWEGILKGADMEYLFYSHGKAKDPLEVLGALLDL
jgi:hypothetical protein